MTFRRFFASEAAGGTVLLVATVIALAWANSPWSSGYAALWESSLLGVTPRAVVNDGLMSIFFLLVGLEIKRELIAGELASIRDAALPMVAAVGGMLAPALLFAAMNHDGPGASGWGIPMATDIAFALGVLALLGARVSTGLRIFVAALAIVDDIGAVLVIALFYSSGLAWTALGAAAIVLLMAIGANVIGVRRPWVYAMLGIALWGAVLLSGIHPSLAGVLLAMTVPVRTPHAPLLRIERGLTGIVAFVIMPLFALANAGIALSGAAMVGIVRSPVTLGVVAGLVLGKPLGITVFSWAAVRCGLARLPTGVSWSMLVGASLLGGIGFTMALFIAGLAYGDRAMLDVAKLGILCASTIAGVLGWMTLRWNEGTERGRSGDGVGTDPHRLSR